MRKDRFTDGALANIKALANAKSQDAESFAEAYDFARCQRPDGTFYGTSGQCRKGTDAGPAQGQKMKIDSRKDVKPAPAKRKAKDEKTVTRQKEMGEIRTQLKGAAAKARGQKTELSRLERSLRAAEKDVKKNRNSETIQRYKQLRSAAAAAESEYTRAERTVEKLASRWHRLNKQKERERMTPAQRAEERRIDKTIKERG
jgi:hypothetical protein